MGEMGEMGEMGVSASYNSYNFYNSYNSTEAQPSTTEAQPTTNDERSEAMVGVDKVDTHECQLCQPLSTPIYPRSDSDSQISISMTYYYTPTSGLSVRS